MRRLVDVRQSKLDPKYASASLAVDPQPFGVASNVQGGDQLVHLLGTGAHGSWFVASSSGTERPCAVEGVANDVLRELYGNRC
jgi:hypothetical protein